MKKGSFILKDIKADTFEKIRYKIKLKKAYDNNYYIFVKFKFEKDLFYRKVKFNYFSNCSMELNCILKSLDRMNEEELITEISRCINIYKEDKKKKKEMKKLRKEWL